MSQKKTHTPPLLLASILLACLPSCAPAKRDFLERTSAAANDRIMYVRETPPTFGHFRLKALLTRYPKLKTLASERSTPDFLAETSKADTRIIILYYLEKRQAYTYRSGQGTSAEVEFVGRYPITDNEAKTLRSLRDGRPPARSSN